MELKISFLILVLLAVNIIVKYIMHVIKLFKAKKILKTIMYLIIPIIGIEFLIFTLTIMGYNFRNIVFGFCYIVFVICVPLINLIFLISKDKINEKLRICLITALIILTIGVYYTNYIIVNSIAEKIIRTITENSLVEVFQTKKDIRKSNYNNNDIIYLQNYTEKYNQNGYLDRYDITNILDIIDSKTSIIHIKYKDSVKNIDIDITNEGNTWNDELRAKLESNYYKFKYDFTERDEEWETVKDVTVYIERIVND